jgi:hypothetical protein
MTKGMPAPLLHRISTVLRQLIEALQIRGCRNMMGRRNSDVEVPSAVPSMQGDRMRTTLFALCGVAVFMSAAFAGGAEAPRTIAGVTLGQPIRNFADIVIMETALPVRYAENLYEVEIRPIEGFKSGLIGYGTCQKDQPVVRIKLKYADDSRAFFDELMGRFKKAFGEPDEYRGDPFQNVIIWKWAFSDKANNRISMMLQHNVMDEDEKMGNVLKLTLLNVLEEDARCYQKKATDQREQLQHRRRDLALKPGESGWGRYLPK